MRQKTWRRAAVLVLVAALVAPAAWAAPGGVGSRGLGGAWSWFARVLAGWADKDGPCIDPDGKPICTPAPAPAAAPAGRQWPNKEGPCIITDGRPACQPVVGAGQPAAATGQRLTATAGRPINR